MKGPQVVARMPTALAPKPLPGRAHQAGLPGGCWCQECLRSAARRRWVLGLGVSSSDLDFKPSRVSEFRFELPVETEVGIMAEFVGLTNPTNLKMSQP